MRHDAFVLVAMSALAPMTTRIRTVLNAMRMWMVNVINQIATISGIVTNVLFAVSIVAAFIPKVRAHFVRHALTIIRESK